MEIKNFARCCMLAVVSVVSSAVAQEERVESQWEVDRIWAVHPSSPPILVTSGGSQYLAYYDAERRLTLAWRKLDDDVWQRRHFPVVTTWATASHALIALAVDADGIIHLVPYRRGLSESPANPPNVIYYRSTHPHDPGSMERSYMISPDEPSPNYPVFHTARDGRLFFECRIGSSGSGDQKLYQYDRESRVWSVVGVLIDGRGEMNAYPAPRLSADGQSSAYGGPLEGPDGRWHYLWMWRDTTDAATNHSLSYMTSHDLRNWQSACGAELTLPITSDESRVVVDPARPGDGMINPSQYLGFDSQKRAIISYHVYATCGNSAILNARFENGGWRRVAAKVWDFRWGFGGGGAVGIPLGTGPVVPMGDGRLVQRVWSEQRGVRHIVLDETTLEPMGQADSAEDFPVLVGPAWRQQFSAAEIDFPLRPMRVSWLPDRGDGGDEPGVRYETRWETAPTNVGDRPVPEPWPEPTPLRVFKVRQAGQ